MRFWAAAWPFFQMPRWSASKRASNRSAWQHPAAIAERFLDG
jgi:hypothetical protein